MKQKLKKIEKKSKKKFTKKFQKKIEIEKKINKQKPHLTFQKNWSLFCDTQTENYFVRWEIILAGLVTTRQSHPVRARKAREFLIPKKEREEKRNLIHRFTNTEP